MPYVDIPQNCFREYKKFLSPKGNISYVSIKKNKEKIIKSDYRLINKDSNFEVKINNILSRI